jgi:hypothetical protein
MKKRKKFQIKNININLSNKTFYTILLVSALILLGVGVYAYTGTVGHTSDQIDEVDPQVGAVTSAKWCVGDGSAVQCNQDAPSGGDSDWIISGSDMYSGISGNVGIGTTSPGAKLDVNGNVLADGFYYRSDERLKENVLIIDNALSIIESLEGVSFNWKENGERSIGLIAQDAEKILPEIVSTSDKGYKSIQYANLVAVLIEAIKEQQKQIDELKEQLNK